MKRITKILSFICLAGVIVGGIQAAKQLPADTSSFVQKKYAGWSGVLRGWVYSDWSCAGSFVSWLNGCAAEFEKQHEGVYLEFETVSREAIAAADIHPPEIKFFSGSLLGGEATAVAMGGYIIVEHPGASGTAIPAEYAAAMIAMHGATEGEVDLPDSGMDLGLPAMGTSGTIEIDENAFRRFCNGELGRTIVNQQELAKLISLRDSGRGPDWKCVPGGAYAWCDQRLMMQVYAEGEQEALCEEFREWLLREGSQRALGRIGGFPVTEAQAYDDHSAYRAMEVQMQIGQRLYPKTEHWGADFAALVRKLYAGGISHGEAIEILAQTCS